MNNNKRLPGILRPIIIGPGKPPVTLYYYTSETNYTSNIPAHIAGTSKTWYYQYDFDKYEYTIANSIGNQEWKVGENIAISNLDSICQQSDYNYRLNYPKDSVTSTFVDSNNITVKAIDKDKAILGTIFTYSGNQNGTMTFDMDRAIPKYVYTTGGGLYYNGSDGSYAGPLNGLLIENTFDMSVSSTNYYGSPIIQSSPMSLGLDPFFT